MRKRGMVVTLTVLSLALSMFLVPSGPASAQQKVIKLGLTAAEGTPEVVASREFAKILEKKSGGAMRADILAGGLAGGERDIVEGQQIGSLHMSVVSGIIQNFDPAMMILEYEFLFKNEDHVKKVMNGPIGEQINKRLADKAKLRYLAVFMRTPRILTTSKPVNKVGDLKGLKIRVPEMPARLALWRAMGASPTPLAFPEVFTAQPDPPGVPGGLHRPAAGNNRRSGKPRGIDLQRQVPRDRQVPGPDEPHLRFHAVDDRG